MDTKNKVVLAGDVFFVVDAWTALFFSVLVMNMSIPTEVCEGAVAKEANNVFGSDISGRSAVCIGDAFAFCVGHKAIAHRFGVKMNVETVTWGKGG